MSTPGGNVVTINFGGAPYVLLDELMTDLHEALMKHAGRISVAEAVGVLRLLEATIVKEHTGGD